MEKKPNLLFIFTDEQAAKTMAAYGNKMIETPNLNKLANESIVFENAYVTQPVCTPSRSTLMTGLYPHTNGCTANNIQLSEDTLCFPEMADFADYKVAYHGKWHLGDEIFRQHGYQEWVSIDDGYRRFYSDEKDKNDHSSYYHFLVENGFKPDVKTDDCLVCSPGIFVLISRKNIVNQHFWQRKRIGFWRETSLIPLCCL